MADRTPQFNERSNKMDFTATIETITGLFGDLDLTAITNVFANIDFEAILEYLNPVIEALSSLLG